MKGDKTDPYLVSPACQEVINKGYTSFDDCPVWAILEQVEAILLNKNIEPAAYMIAAVRARLPNLDAEDVAQWNPVQTKFDWELELEEEAV
tara:strand:+ start:2752 stop:3024 length:273 start_codon:yes stop_codon:yes gene_type:complete